MTEQEKEKILLFSINRLSTYLLGAIKSEKFNSLELESCLASLMFEIDALILSRNSEERDLFFTMLLSAIMAMRDIKVKDW